MRHCIPLMIISFFALLMRWWANDLPGNAQHVLLTFQLRGFGKQLLLAHMHVHNHDPLCCSIMQIHYLHCHLSPRMMLQDKRPTRPTKKWGTNAYLSLSFFIKEICFYLLLVCWYYKHQDCGLDANSYHLPTFQQRETCWPFCFGGVCAFLTCLATTTNYKPGKSVLTFLLAQGMENDKESCTQL